MSQSLVNETTNSNVLGPRGRGGHDGSGSGGGIKGGGEEAKTNLGPRHPHTLPSDNNTKARGSAQEEPVKRKKDRERNRERDRNGRVGATAQRVSNSEKMTSEMGLPFSGTPGRNATLALVSGEVRIFDLVSLLSCHQCSIIYLVPLLLIPKCNAKLLKIFIFINVFQ